MSKRLASNAEVLEEMLADPQFRAEWERTALARVVAEAVTAYRAEHRLSQSALAQLLGWSQPVVAGWRSPSTTRPWTPCSRWPASSACRRR